MVYRRLALITTLLAAFASGCGTSQVSEKGSPPVKATTLQTPTAATTPLVTAAPTPARAVELPLGESSKHEVDVFMGSPDYFTRMYLARKFDTQASNIQIIRIAKPLAPLTNVAPTIYLMYMWANYPTGTYPNVQQFMTSYMEDPRAFGRTAEDWLESNPCTWLAEVQEQVVAVERNSPGWLRASIAQVSLELWAAKSVIRNTTTRARDEYFDDREAYLDQFRCTSEGGGTANRTQVAWPTVPTQVATAAIPTPAVEILDTPRQPGLARELVVSYLAEKLGQGSASRNVQYRADRLAFLTESAPWALDMYIKAGYRIPVADEHDFYAMYLVIPACVVSHPGLSEGQVAAFTTEFNRRWPDVNPRTMPGIAAIEEMAEAQQGELCTLFSTTIETTKPD